MTRRDTIIISLVYVLGIIWITLNNYLKISLTLCPTKAIFGIPCPGCGITRAIMLSLKGELIAALQLNPNIALAWILIPFAPVLVFFQITTKRNYIGKINSTLNKKGFLIPFGIIEGLIWAYNIVRNI